MIKYEDVLDKMLRRIEKDALSDNEHVADYADGRLLGLRDSAIFLGNDELYSKIDVIIVRVEDKKQARHAE